MLKTTNAHLATDHVVIAALSNLYPEHSRIQAWSESGEGLERCDASRLRHLLRCKLAWFGLRSVEVGSFRLLTNDALLVDLLEARGVIVCRIQVDRRSGAIKRSACHALSRLLASEQQQANDSWGATPLFVQ
jgi:hypothetical protein